VKNGRQKRVRKPPWIFLTSASVRSVLTTKPIVVTIAGDPPAYVIRAPGVRRDGAEAAKQLLGVPVEVAIDAWNRQVFDSLVEKSPCPRTNRGRRRDTQYCLIR
jgi:hypothetical protein